MKTQDTDGYTAVQVGYNKVARKEKLNKPETGHLEKAGLNVRLSHLEEFRVSANTAQDARVVSVVSFIGL